MRTPGPAWPHCVMDSKAVVGIQFGYCRLCDQQVHAPWHRPHPSARHHCFLGRVWHPGRIMPVIHHLHCIQGRDRHPAYQASYRLHGHSGLKYGVELLWMALLISLHQGRILCIDHHLHCVQGRDWLQLGIGYQTSSHLHGYSGLRYGILFSGWHWSFPGSMCGGGHKMASWRAAKGLAATACHVQDLPKLGFTASIAVSPTRSDIAWQTSSPRVMWH